MSTVLRNYMPGDRVRVVCAAIAGLTGAVHGADSVRTIVKIDSWPGGVYLEISSSMLEPLSPDCPQCGRSDCKRIDALERADDVPAIIYVFRCECGCEFESTRI